MASILAASCLLGAGAPEPSGARPEYEVKAAFLYNFAKFTEWPGERTGAGPDELVIGILGDDPFGPTLDRLVARKQVRAMPVRIQRYVSSERIGPCQILFIAAGVADKHPELLTSLRDLPVLTVGEDESFTKHGGVLRFVEHRSRIRFEINVDAAAQAGLRISSKLLDLATLVRDPESRP